MKISIENLGIEYECFGEGKDLILLHGWGANHHTFDALIKHLSENFKVYAIDLPGFGESDIFMPLSVSDVCDILHGFVESLGIQNPIILGHSYGGRIAMVYASRYSVKKLILVCSPGFKKELSWHKKMNVTFYKLCKKLRINLNMGSADYKNSSSIMKKTLVKTVSYDLTNEMRMIKAPTLLIGGEIDKTVSKAEMEKIKENINGSALVLMEGTNHFPYLERPIYFTLILDAFLAEVER